MMRCFDARVCVCVRMLKRLCKHRHQQQPQPQRQVPNCAGGDGGTMMMKQYDVR